MKNLEIKVKEIILGLIKEHDIEFQSEICEHHNLKDDLGFDSINMVHLVVKIEDEFDIDIFSEGKISTVIELIAFIKKHKNG
tara:strand:- start:240 stop:485 length:246 start_codon:yes stop_codon:yes gene_type:complete